MLNPQTMTEQEERDARDRAFYLVKRYTSYTFLDQTRALHQQLLNAFARQLNNPARIERSLRDDKPQSGAGIILNVYENDYRSFLKEMICFEEGLSMLRNTTHKREAYKSIASCDFDRYLSGRRADERGLADNPFYNALGYGRVFVNSPMWILHRGTKQLEALRKTVEGSTARYLIDLEGRFTAKFWAYDLIFFVDRYGDDWPVPRVYPSPLPPCPPKNTNPEGQIWSGEEIPTTGIWEPWFIKEQVCELWESLLGGSIGRLKGKTKAESKPTGKFTGKVGCPNYFLAGSTAFEYEMEGTDKKAKVAWRLLWEDTRYLDGTIPEEENDYLAAPETVDAAVLTAHPGEPCPESGEWYAVNWEDKRMLLQKGEQLPGPEFSTTGAVIWLLRKETP